PREESWRDPAYTQHVAFRAQMSRDMAERIHAFLRQKRPDVALFQGDWAEVRIHEVNNAIGRELPLWRYHAGEVAKRDRTTSSKPVVILSVAFVDIPYRFSHDYPGLMGLHLAQALANAANPHFYVIGTTDQLDRKQFPLVKELYRFAEEHEGLYR